MDEFDWLDPTASSWVDYGGDFVDTFSDPYAGFSSYEPLYYDDWGTGSTAFGDVADNSWAWADPSWNSYANEVPITSYEQFFQDPSVMSAAMEDPNAAGANSPWSPITDAVGQWWKKDPTGMVMSLGGGALALLSSYEERKRAKKLEEEERKRLEAANRRNAALDLRSETPLFQGRPPMEVRQYNPLTDPTGYGVRGGEHTFFTGGPQVSRGDFAFAGAAGGALNDLMMSGGMESEEPGEMIEGPGGGQDDGVLGLVSEGEFIIPADVVAALGDGNNEAGADQLYQLIEAVRASQGRDNELPPKSKSPLEYLAKGN